MKRLFFTCVVVLALHGAGCTTAPPEAPIPDAAKERQSLLAVHEAGNQAHIETDAAALLENAADTFVAVSNGQIYSQSKSDVEAFFTEYFENATYSEYADIEPPIVRVSDDGTMGWVINRLRANRTEPGPDGEPRSREFVYAGVMLFEKRDGKWLRVGNVSTFE